MRPQAVTARMVSLAGMPSANGPQLSEPTHTIAL
jgi:hypothetical protein